MLVKFRQLVGCVQEFIYLMYNFLEMLGEVIEIMLPSRGAVCGNNQRLLPVRTLNPLMQMNAYRRRWISWDLSRTGHTRHLNPARHPSLWSPYSG